ncbi:hypothetical protein [uncultured Lacinutrix sp.]|uniref:hypothetical protein n=1 Tax=uncultured Lacinutrix sp. TaxID=574032 RepID=UPI00262070A1|nr:hypothetical protein [uncultured Lacinutrix sp.]
MNVTIKQAILLLSLFFISNKIYTQDNKENPNLQAAYQAYNALKLNDAKQLFETVVNTTKANKKDRCKALRELAIIDWKFYKNYKKAKNRLYLADSIGDYRSETWLKLLRVEVESNHFKEALKAGKKAILLSESKADKSYSKYKYCKVILDEAIHNIFSDKNYDTTKLKEASLILNALLEENPTNVNASNILLGISLLLKQGNLAMKAWLSYYRFTNVNSVYDFLKPSAKQLNTILPYWDDTKLTTPQQETLIEGLGRSRFYTYAKVLAKIFKFKDIKTKSSTTKIITYANYIEDVKIFTNEYYRLVSIDTYNSDDFINGLRALNKKLYKTLLASETKKDSFSLNNFRDLIRSKFGSVFIIAGSSSSRQVGLVFGHIVNERIRHVEQYGKGADFTFTELDMMISNGYPSWFWENRGAGGYALSSGFLRIKSMFNYLAIDAWDKVTDKVKRKKIEESIATNLLTSTLSTDIKIIRSEVSKKIELDALDSIYSKLVATGLNDIELQLKFIEQYELHRDNATMFAHEGRHCIDRLVLGDDYRALGSAKIEYRGRLSQIAFSKAPKLELANILVGVSSTPTGQSNKMILEVLENYIKRNRNKIKNYDFKKQPIAQLYKLTDEQIISCIQSVDPFYINKTKED